MIKRFISAVQTQRRATRPIESERLDLRDHVNTLRIVGREGVDDVFVA